MNNEIDIEPQPAPIETEAECLARIAEEEERSWKAERKASMLRLDPDYQDAEELRAAVLAVVKRKTDDYGKIRKVVEVLLGSLSVGEIYTLFRHHLRGTPYSVEPLASDQLIAIRDATR